MAPLTHGCGPGESLPLKGKPASPSEAPGSGVALVVEDEALIRMMVCTCLAEAGLQVVEAVGAAEALAACDAVPVMWPATLVTDLDLGAGPEQGLALAEEVLRRRPSLCGVVYLTGYPEHLAAARGWSALPPWERFISKPLNLLDLVATVQELMLRRAALATGRIR